MVNQKLTKMQTPILSFFIIFSFCINVFFCKKYYNNYTLYRGIPSTKPDLEFYQNLSQKFDVNYWREPGVLFKPVEFVVSPEDKPVFLDEAKRHGLYITTLIEDVQKVFDMQTVKTYVRRNMDSFDWNSYFRVDDIYQWLKDLEKFNPVEIKVDSIGKTSQGREIMAARILLRGHKARSKVVVEGGIHAREWIAPAFVTYLIHQIIHSPTSGNKKLKEVALKYEWYFVPVLNPDGYEHSITTDRLWRKNRNGAGVDVNRNFDSDFGTVGVSYDKNSETYCGPSPFSEKESDAMRTFLLQKKENIKYYLAFHSYGQYIIIPYAHSKIHQENFEEVKGMCMKAVPKIAAKYRTKYTVGTAYDTVGYTTSGVSGCWVKKELRVPYVITFELRDDGFFGFALPPQDILPTCQETLDGILTLLDRKSNSTNKKLRGSNDSARPHFILDDFVIVFNVLLFIIVRFG